MSTCPSCKSEFSDKEIKEVLGPIETRWWKYQRSYFKKECPRCGVHLLRKLDAVSKIALVLFGLKIFAVDAGIVNSSINVILLGLWIVIVFKQYKYGTTYKVDS